MKKFGWLTLLLAMILVIGSIATAKAEIISPYGAGQIGYRGAVLCEELTLREKPSTSAKTVQILQYGSFIIVMEQENGWAHCVLGDAEEIGRAHV